MEKINRIQLIELLDDALKDNPSYTRDDTSNNPCRIKYDEDMYYIYVKNLSSAYFSNPDVTRSQLTGVDSLNDIKNSEENFILLGYDYDNDVYAVWNPFFLKQRIGTAKSPSLYSRESLQKQASSENKFIKRILNNDLEVLLFPRKRIGDFLENITLYFPDMSEYVAIGSKRRTSANNAYKTFSDMGNLDGFAQYLTKKGTYNDNYVSSYCHILKEFFSSGLISQNRKVFLKYDSLVGYKEALNTLLQVDDVAQFDKKYNYLASFVLSAYVEFLISYYKGEIVDDEQEKKNDDDKEEKICFTHSSDFPSDYAFTTDWEGPFTDEDSKLKVISNPILIQKLQPILDCEYKSTTKALNIVEQFYGKRYPTMQLSDWTKLFKNIDWEKPYYVIVDEIVVNKQEFENPVAKPILALRIIDKDNNELINEIPDELILKLIDQFDGNEKIEEYLSPFESCNKVADSDLILYDIENLKECKALLECLPDFINGSYNVDVIDTVDNSVIIKSNYKLSGAKKTESQSERQKIRVTFEDGTDLKGKNVGMTFVEAIKRIGVNQIRDLEIINNGDNLVTPNINPMYKKAMKPLDNDYYVNTNTSTKKKYSILRDIKDRLNLKINIELY